MAESSKIKLLYILDIMRKTDEQHPVNSSEIARKLREYGIEAERKSISRDLECLENAGYEIIKCDNHNLGWYMSGQEFEDHELKMLADAVAAAKFLTETDTNKLLKKIKNLATKEGERLIDATLVMDPELKIDDRQFNIKFDTIMRAITERKQLRFQYIEYMDGTKKVLRREGHVYQVNPYFITLYNDEYFLICNPVSHDHVTYFRIEKITGLRVYNEPVRPMREVRELKDIGRKTSIGDYLRQNINLRASEPVDVVLGGDNARRHDVIFKFGRSVPFRDDGENRFTARIRVAADIGFYYWLAAYGTDIWVLEPDSVKQGFKEYLRKILDNYQD